MPNPARLRRINDDRTRSPMPIVFIVTMGPGRWQRVPPWRPRSLSLPPHIALPAPIVPDADIARPDQRPALFPNRQPENAS